MTEEAQTCCCLPESQPRLSSTTIPLIMASAPAEDTRSMVHLTGGTFLMGSEGPEIWKADGEGPIREVEVAPFWIDDCAVTNARFAAFIEATGYETEAERFGWSYVFYKHVSAANKDKTRGYSGEANWWLGVEGAMWRRPEGPGSDIKKRLDHPVVHVSWNDAQAFCQWAGKQLPTETQWEYAARGGLVQQLYPWGNELTPKGKNGKPEHRCNIWQGKFPTLDTGQDGWTNTAPVKTFKPNAFGLYQMSGNTWEWCADPFATNPTRTTTNLSRRVVKGGSFLCHVSYCNRYRCAARTGNTPDSTTSHTGFRCIRTEA
ncbi:serine/threonine-protein kinase pkn1 [Abditibacteriota bacterium]|nr:serine/threonine-protein kinase pkn1 [Abditibacteriota bacterium]